MKTIPITRPGKMQLEVTSPVMPAAGTFGFGGDYDSLINVDYAGAVITNPVTYNPRTPANGTRVVPLAAGVLIHTGLPNPGLSRTIRRYRDAWKVSPAPVIVHVVGTHASEVRQCAERLDMVDGVAGLEIGLQDDISANEAAALTEAAVRHTEKPVLVRLPMYDAYEIAQVVADAGAGALVVAAAPRGAARDPYNGRLVDGRVYGPLIKPMVLRMVRTLSQRLGEVPIIGAGGIHTIQDARDFIEEGAVAVQVDSLLWIRPHAFSDIAKDLAGLVITKESGALADEWYPGKTDRYKPQ